MRMDLQTLIKEKVRFKNVKIHHINNFRYGGAAGMPGASQSTTMTLGRKGHYASLRSARAHQDMNDLPLLGPNQGQYATLSKGCKTLESSDFY